MSDLPRFATIAVALCLAALMIGPFQDLEDEVGVSDKLAHAAAFALIAATLFLNWRAGSRIQITAVALVIGVSVEAIQGATGRDMETSDIVADLAGIILTTVCWRGRRLR